MKKEALKRALIATLPTLALLGGAAACSSNADVVSDNISKAADNFEVARRIVFINNMTGDYLLSIEGRCNITADGDGTGQLEVTCRTPQGDKKHFLGLNHTTTYFVEQVSPISVSQDHYKVYFKPSVIIPDIDAK